jgi:hypothetical protein
MLEGARAGFVHERRAAAAPATVVAMPVRRRPVSTFVPWAAAATFAVLAGYQAFVAGPAMRNAGPLALAPQTLRASTRGQEPVVSPGPGGMVTLALDLPDAAAQGEVAYDLSRAAGPSIAAGRVPAPQPGTPLLLLVPATLLSPETHYVLTVRDTMARGLTYGEYRFTVAAR